MALGMALRFPCECRNVIVCSGKNVQVDTVLVLVSGNAGNDTTEQPAPGQGQEDKITGTQYKRYDQW